MGADIFFQLPDWNICRGVAKRLDFGKSDFFCYKLK